MNIKMILRTGSLAVLTLGMTAAAWVAGAVQYSGIVLNEIGRPAANATVSLERISEPGKAMSVVTDTTGTFSFIMTSVGDESKPVPFGLYGNFPNPFNPHTRISYSIDQGSDVVVRIYNALGQQVRTMFEGYRDPGFFSAVWDGRDDSGRGCSAGVYLYRLTAGNHSAVAKMLMVDSATGAWIPGRSVHREAYRGNEDRLFTVTVTHPDAEALIVGPITLENTSEAVLNIHRIIDKMQRVSKNTYTRGTDWYHHAKPLHKVNITHDYLIDKYEVTGEVFCRVMNYSLKRGALNVDSLVVKNAEGTPQPLFQLDSPERRTNICIEFVNGEFAPKSGMSLLPLSHVSWYGAMFFCHERSRMEGLPQAIDIEKWTCDFESTGYRLPTDAEWELAGAWTDQREYAYGPDPGWYRPMNTQLNPDGFEDELSPVGWFSPQGDSHDGCCDLSGNLYEWTWDWMEFYHQNWVDSTLVDPKGPVTGYNKVVRGGTAYGCFRAARVADRANVLINRMTQEIGFRTIRVLKED